MAYYATVVAMAPKGSVGNNTHGAVNSSPDSGREGFQFVVEAVGATPTVTWQIQGSNDGVTFFPVIYVTDASDTPAVAAITVTAVGTQTVFLANSIARFYKQFRLVTSANTNVTYRGELYEVPGSL